MSKATCIIPNCRNNTSAADPFCVKHRQDDRPSLSPEQIELLRDKVAVWRQQAVSGNMELRDYNRRCADALEAALRMVAR